MYLDDRNLKINQLNEMVLIIRFSLYLKYKVLKINANFFAERLVLHFINYGECRKKRKKYPA